MIELVATACLIGNMGFCKDVDVKFYIKEVSFEKCQTFNGPRLKAWLESSHKWKVTKWECRAIGAPGV